MGYDKVTKEDARKLAMEEFEADLDMGIDAELATELNISSDMYWSILPMNFNLPEDRRNELARVMTETYLIAAKNNGVLDNSPPALSQVSLRSEKHPT